MRGFWQKITGLWSGQPQNGGETARPRPNADSKSQPGIDPQLLIKNRLDPGPATAIPPRPEEYSPPAGEEIGWGYKTAWLAVKADNLEGVALALGLREPRWALWSEAVELAYSHDSDYRSWHWLVTPSIRGWVLVMSTALLGGHFVVDQTMREKFHTFLSRLSEKFDEVQFFGTHRVADIDAWGRWVNGQCQRLVSFDGYHDLEQYGEIQSTVEAHLLTPKRFIGDDGQEAEYIHLDEGKVMAMAAEWSLDPTELYKIDIKQTEAGPVLTGWLPQNAWNLE